MATNYPTSLDTFTNPSAGDSLNSPSHSAQHADINDAMEAVQAKLGVGAGTIGSWTTFTPSWNNFTAGNAVEVWHYAVVNDVLFIEGRTTLSGSTMGTNPGFDLPNGYSLQNLGQPYGNAAFSETGTAELEGFVVPSGPNEIRFVKYEVSGSQIKRGTVSTNSPFQWGDGDQIRAVFQVRLT